MKIITKLLITLVFTSLLPLIAFFLFSYVNFSRLFIQEELKDLSEISRSRILYIEEYFNTLEDFAELYTHSPQLIDNFQMLSKAFYAGGISSENYKKVYSETKIDLSYYRHLLEIYEVFFLSREGDVIYTSFGGKDLGQNLNGNLLKDTDLSKLFHYCKNKLEPNTSNFEIYPPTKTPLIFIGSPMIVKDEFIGVFCFAMPPKEVYKIFENYTSLRDTGEVLIAKKIGDRLMFVNPIRHNRNAAFDLSVPFGSKIALPMQEAVRGISGKGISIDYRGKKVLAVWNYFPKLNCGIVVKIDYEEISHPFEKFFLVLLIIGFATVLIAIAMATISARAITYPILKLQEATEQIGKGDLDYKIELNSRDELGSLARDFSEMQEKLKQSTTSIHRLNIEIEERKRAEEVKSELITRVSHELRTPLAPIKEGIELALKEDQLSQQQIDLLNLSKNNADRLNRLVDDILDFEKLTEQKYTYEFIESNINDLIQESITKIGKDLEKTQLKLSTQLDDHIPLIMVDQTKIIQVMSNLLSNAIKYTNEGEIVVSSKNQEQNVLVSIKDTGVGITEDDKQRLFQNFMRLGQETKRQSTGTGLGLVIAKQIIEDHGGKIWLESRINEGSTFSFTIPKARNEQKDTNH